MIYYVLLVGAAAVALQLSWQLNGNWMKCHGTMKLKINARMTLLALVSQGNGEFQVDEQWHISGQSWP